jgi:hypothetical protein
VWVMLTVKASVERKGSGMGALEGPYVIQQVVTELVLLQSGGGAMSGARVACAASLTAALRPASGALEEPPGSPT